MKAILEEVRIGIHAVWRRRWLALAVAWSIALIGWLAISLIPNTYESTARIYSYDMVNPQGELIAKQLYDYTTSRPHLKVDESGKIFVAGGQRHYTEDDVPASAGQTVAAPVEVKAPKAP